MIEREYILVRNITNVQAAINALKDCIPVHDFEKGRVLAELREWQDSMYEEVLTNMEVDDE